MEQPVARSRVSELDLLRFFAAFSVLLYHYTFRGYAAGDMSIMPYPLLAPISKYGYLGVDLFFLISGFVILMSASSGSLKRFAISRIVRLYPAFWVCCTVTFIAIILLDVCCRGWEYAADGPSEVPFVGESDGPLSISY